MTAAQRSKSELDRLYKAAVDTRRAIYAMISLWPGPDPNALLDASIGLDGAISEYLRPVTAERTFNALRDAISRAEAEMDKYHRQV